MKKPVSRTKALASAAVTAGLCLTGTVALSTPSQAATGSCDTAFPVADLTADQVVHGLTVTSGTTPSTFDGTVIGVLHDGIEPGVDMVMMKLSSPEITQVGGIWEGMSGSPVYASDGSLIGAVAYTLSYGSTPVAGITPWEDMEQYAGTATGAVHVKVSAAAAKKIAAATDVTTSQAASGFRELQAPTVVSGLGPRALSEATGRPYLSGDVAAAGRSTGASSPNESDLVAGGNLLATEATGDIVFGGLGTITSVCAGRVVGFGHPMEFAGNTTYGMAGADALYIQGDSLGSPYKVANLGDILGTIDQDRMTGISGPIGPKPDSTPITSTVTYHPDSGDVRTRTGSSDVQLPSASAAVTFYELVNNHQSVLDAYQKGSEAQSWTVHGHSADGPFTFKGGNRYTDSADITFGSSFDLPDLVYLLTNVDGVTVDSVDVTSDVVDDSSVLKIVGADQRRGGAWHGVDAHKPLLLKAHSKATLRLRYAGGTHGPAFQVAVPAGTTGFRGYLSASEAESYPFERGFPRTLAGVTKLVQKAERNDQARIDFSAFGGKARSVTSHQVTTPGNKVVTGHLNLKVKVS
jgi:hypothetical protein